ncbi:MAG TPA: DUF3298 and DUF4163 domain-containing protein [Pyrinomonadaceae bacterium]|nr:DUF3298 and DUF4163 domain-containing protein [Pyrinomonadaceae bacterium]
MVKNKFILSAILMFAATICASAQAKAKIFRGYLNGTAIEMSLVRDGGKLSGSYLYTRIGKGIKLAGTIDAEGTFKLRETDAAGKTTGEFWGKWTEEPNSNGISLEGEWRKPNSKSTLGFFAGEQIVEFSSEAKFTAKSFAEKNNPKHFEINIEYPELSGANPAAAKFNQLIKTEAMSGVNDFRKEMLAMTAEDIKFLPKGTNNYLNVAYGIEWATDDIISVKFTNSVFSGGAHPNYDFSTVNFDLKNGTEIKLADLFEPNTNYLKVLSDYSIADLKTRLTDMVYDEWIRTGAGAKSENYESWNLTKKGLMITFAPYQVASYADGEQTVIIPYNKLNEILRKDFAPLKSIM